jgi:hypothetical protein
VFTGELVEVWRRPLGPFSSSDPARFVFEVEAVYKGQARARQSVVTPAGGAGCGLDLNGRGPFLVFAGSEPVLDLEAEDGELYSTSCSGTRGLDVAPVPAAFGEGRPPAPGSSPIERPDEPTPVLLLVVAEAALVLLVVAVGSRVARARGDHSSLPTG